MTEEKKSEPNVSIAFGATASAELKAEIPTSSMGRLVDALTDVIRPFTEIRGLKADQIRLQREDVLFLVAEKARRRLDQEARVPEPIPTKVLVPLLEKASLEDPVDTEMLDRWAELLASASMLGGVDPRLVGILSELGAREANLLEEIYWGSDTENRPVRDPHINERVNKLRGEFNAKLHVLEPGLMHADLDELVVNENPLDHIMAYIDLVTSRPAIRSNGWSLSSGKYFQSGREEKIPDDLRVSVDILTSLGLLSLHELNYRYENMRVGVRYHQITALGIKFLSVCSARVGKDLAAIWVDAEKRRLERAAKSQRVGRA